NSRNQAQNPSSAARPGSGSGFRGMLGGFLAGSLLGALLFGGPYSGFGMMDMVLVALLAFLALKLVKAFLARRTAGAAAGGDARAADFGARQDQWHGLQGTASPAGAAGGPNIRLAGFDQEDFLRGARMLYTRLQDSWDRRDLDDIATFTTPAILSEVEAQAEADPAPSTTEIMLVNASLVSAERDGDEDVATVYFDVLLREDRDAGVPGQVRELWHFIRPAGSAESWRLDGIQQVE
ncbi:MAG: 39S ribosomal protein L45, partial [Deltaproteobacteria bacterium]|nr:39S ribosomal protein L45 [Deltaproteobacteria bacterium]